jgi:hypothetical protein
MVNSIESIVRGRNIAMVDCSNNGYAPELKNTVYGVDTAIIVVVFASAAFWFSVGLAVWLFV